MTAKPGANGAKGTNGTGPPGEPGANGANGADGAGAAPVGRGMVPGLENPNPLSMFLPAAFQDDEFALRFMSGLDEVLAPVFGTLDCLDAYLDPQLAPEDFLEWLASWVGLELDETWPLERQRRYVAEAVRLSGRRGTVTGLRELVALHAGVEPEVDDNGGVSWSPTPGGAVPGSPEPSVRVTVRGGQADRRRLRAIVAEQTPAHVPFTVEVEKS